MHGLTNLNIYRMSVCQSNNHQLISHFICYQRTSGAPRMNSDLQNITSVSRVEKSLHQFPLLKILEMVQAIRICWASDVT